MIQGQIDLKGVFAGISQFMTEGQFAARPPATPDPWPKDKASLIRFYDEVQLWRTQTAGALANDPKLAAAARAYYQTRPCTFINHWVWTFDPRNVSRGLPTKLPLVLFPKQKQFIKFIHTCMLNEVSGLCEKSRTMGATWTACGYSIWLWLFHANVSIGWGSRKGHLVDHLGNPDSIFEKLRIIVRNLPSAILPTDLNEDEHLVYMRCLNPQNGSSITGEAGDNIGRGGRKLIYFKDESAHYERAERIEAALMDNTRCQIDISSINPDTTGASFTKRRDAGVEWKPGMKLTKDKTYVFILDYFDHPGNSREEHTARKKKAEDEGLGHVFAREIDRDYSATLDQVCIPRAWIDAAIDAHKKLGFDDTGMWVAGLDVADGGLDRDALVRRKGSIVKFVDEWKSTDGGVCARRAVAACDGLGPIEVNYDCIGVGASVKSEINRLEREQQLPKSIKVVAWHAGTTALDPSAKVNPEDKAGPSNKDFFANLKAQGWWKLRRRFELTYRAVVQGETALAERPDELISLPSDLPLLQSLIKELAQPVFTQSSNLRLMVDKTPDGKKSPNMGDAMVMAFHPYREPKKTMSLFGPRIIS